MCEVPTVPLTIHHQQTKPKCPSGYKATFQGHSLLTISTGKSNEFITQDAASTGSCLQKYTSETVIKCNERSCTRSSPDDTLWIGEVLKNQKFNCIILINFSYSSPNKTRIISVAVAFASNTEPQPNFL